MKPRDQWGPADYAAEAMVYGLLAGVAILGILLVAAYFS